MDYSLCVLNANRYPVYSSSLSMNGMNFTAIGVVCPFLETHICV